MAAYGARRTVMDGWLAAVEALPLVELSASGVVMAVNQSYCALVDRTASELVGCSIYDYTHPDDVLTSRRNFEMQPGGPDSGRQFEKRYLRTDGTIVWVRVTSVWRSDVHRVFGCVLDIGSEIGARRRQEALIAHAADPILVIDANGYVSDLNPAAARLFGSAANRSALEALIEHLDPDTARVARLWLAKVIRRAGVHPPVTVPVRTDDGRQIQLRVLADNQLLDASIRGIIVNARDVTEELARGHEAERQQKGLVDALVRTTEYRDPYTAGHQSRVAELTRSIGERLGVDEVELAAIVLGASIHDLGKIAVPAEILARPGALSSPERDLIKSHCRVGHAILEQTGLSSNSLDVVLHHHERLDGSGYPDGLMGDEISLASRIVAVADVFEAMTSHRPYRPARDRAHARAELQEKSGRIYDADVVAAVLELADMHRASS